MSFAAKLTSERRSRLAAERMLELKQAELFAANRKLGKHAKQLSEEIVETRAEVENMRGENRKVKSDLTAANRRIALTERRLWQSIQTINDGFAFFNGDNKMIMANRAYLAIFDGLEEIRPGVDYVTILQIMTDEGIVDPGGLRPSVWRQQMIERVQNPHPEPTEIRLWNGRHVRLLDQRGPDGDMVSLGLDITESVRYGQELEAARAVAESANRAKSAFLANMSHEIRTPMNGVVGMADVLTDTELTEEQKLYVDTIRNSGEALLVIINDVLDYSKIEAKKLVLHPENFDLERAIQEILMLLQPNAEAKGLSLVLDYDVFLPSHLNGDPGRLRQVITNLISNAVKFTNDGHVLIRVTGVPGDGDKTVSVHITIEDTGIGISKDMIGHIFGEFNQVENERNRQFDGTGLGLAISQRLVELMGGSIWVTSEEGVGSCFGFKLPLDIIDMDTSNVGLNLNEVGKILVVSDVEATRNTLFSQLCGMGGDPLCSADASSAAAALGDDISLVLVDSQMSEMDGPTMAHFLHSVRPDVPVIALCAQPAKLDKHPLRDALQAVLPFPPPRNDLIARIHGLALPTVAPTPKVRLLRVLAAEDNKTNQLVFSKMIKALNIDLTFAHNGQEAVDLYSELDPDIVFMDISMPLMDGKEATQAIRALEKDSQRHVPIVAMTAHAMSGDDAGILAAGLDHYLTKPLRKAEITAHIENVHGDGMAPLIVD